MLLCNKRLSSGFSLIEVLAVVVIIAVVAGLTVTVFEGEKNHGAPRLDALEFASTVESARQYAVTRKQRVRIVFADEELEKHTVGEFKKGQAYGVYYFYVPHVPNEVNGPQSLTNSDRSEVVPLGVSVLPSGFVGQWMPCNEVASWRKLPPQVVVSVNWTSYPTPSSVWSPATEGMDTSAATNAMSPFPANYVQTPYPQSYALVTTVQPPDEMTFSQGKAVNFQALWSQSVVLNYFDISGVENLSAFGQLESATTTNRRFFDLSGFEYDENGKLYLKDTNALEINFVDQNRTNNTATIRLDTETGLPKLITK